MNEKKMTGHQDKFTLSHSTNGIQQHSRKKLVPALSCNFAKHFRVFSHWTGN